MKIYFSCKMYFFMLFIVKWSRFRSSLEKFSIESYSFEYIDVVLCLILLIIYFPFSTYDWTFVSFWMMCTCTMAHLIHWPKLFPQKTQIKVNKLTLTIAKTFIATVSIDQNICHLLSTKIMQAHILHWRASLSGETRYHKSKT